MNPQGQQFSNGSPSNSNCIPGYRTRFVKGAAFPVLFLSDISRMLFSHFLKGSSLCPSRDTEILTPLLTFCFKFTQQVWNHIEHIKSYLPFDEAFPPILVGTS